MFDGCKVRFSPTNRAKRLECGRIPPLFFCALLFAFLLAPNAMAIPSYARQTGLPCSGCHYNPPELNAAGRLFKLMGYVDAMKKDMAYLTSDELGGRNTGSPEIEKAADYVAAQFKAAGLEPAGKDGSYFQPFTFNYGQGKLGTPQTLNLDVNGSESKLKYASEFTPMGVSAAGMAKAEIVFVGFGLSLKEPAYDDYAGIDVKGKIVVVLRRVPNWEDKDNPDNPFQRGRVIRSKPRAGPR